MNRYYLTAIVIVLAAIITVTAEETPIVLDEQAAIQLAPSWTTVAASGRVEAQDEPAADEAWIRVKRGAELEAQTVLRTGRRGRATLTRNADVLIVDPNSRLSLPAVRIDPNDDSTVVQSQGSVVYEVDGRSTRNFKVVTPYLVAGVKGTVFMVTVSDGSASVTVEEGTVEVLSIATGATSDIRAGETVLVDTEQGFDLEIVSVDDRRRSDASDRNKDIRRIARLETRRLNRVMQRGEEELRIAVEMGDMDPIDALAGNNGDVTNTDGSVLGEGAEAEDRDAVEREKVDTSDVFADPTVNPVPPQVPPSGPGTTNPTGDKTKAPKQEAQSGSSN